jgi:WD40 repeat protein
LCQWNLNGDLKYDWGRTHRIQDLAVSPDGHHLVAMTNETQIYIYNFVTRELENEMDLEVKMGSISISHDSRFLLVNKLNGEAQMFDIQTQESVRTFVSGDTTGNYVIRSTFGGANESFVIVGSESASLKAKRMKSHADLLVRRFYLHLAQR